MYHRYYHATLNLRLKLKDSVAVFITNNIYRVVMKDLLHHSLYLKTWLRAADDDERLDCQSFNDIMAHLIFVACLLILDRKKGEQSASAIGKPETFRFHQSDKLGIIHLYLTTDISNQHRRYVSCWLRHSLWKQSPWDFIRLHLAERSDRPSLDMWQMQHCREARAVARRMMKVSNAWF